MIRLQIESEDETELTHRRIMVIRDRLESQGEKVLMTYCEHYTPMQRVILFVLFISGFAFGVMTVLVLCNNS